MTEPTVRDGAPIVNGNPLDDGPLVCVLPEISSDPIFVPDGIYTQEQVIQKAEISHRTLQRWILAGLPQLRPATSKVYFYGADLIAVMRKPSSEFPDYEPNYKATKRKKKKPGA